MKDMNENMMFINTASKFWKDNVDLAKTIPTKEIGAISGLKH